MHTERLYCHRLNLCWHQWLPKTLFVRSPDVAIEVNVHVLQLQRKMVKK